MGNILYVGQRGAINSAFAPFSKSSGYATAGASTNIIYLGGRGGEEEEGGGRNLSSNVSTCQAIWISLETLLWLVHEPAHVGSRRPTNPCSGTCICQLARLQVGSLYTNKTISLGGALLKHNAISLDGASLIH